MGPPQGPPPELLGDNDPVEAFEDVRRAVLGAYGKEGVLDEERNQMMAGIAFVDTLAHGWEPEVEVSEDATPQDKLIAYMGRNPN